MTVFCAVDAHGITGGRVGVGGDVGYAAAKVLAGIGRRRNPGVVLVGRQRKLVADSATSRTIPGVIPDDFTRDLGGAGIERGAAARQHIRAGGGEVAVCLPVTHAVARPAVARGDADRDSQGGRMLKRLVELLQRLRGPARSGPPQLMEITEGLFTVSFKA